jgi:outer membrane protein
MRSLRQSTITNAKRAALCALVLFLPISADAAAPSAQQLATYESLPETERVKLLVFMAKSPDAANVAALLKRYPLEGPFAANRKLFLEGLVFKTIGKYTQAAAKFRAALADDPSLTLVRSELAETLVILQEDDSALHQLKLLEAEAPDVASASGIRSFIDQVDSRRPYTINGYVSLAPSTNLNNGSSHTTVYSPTLKVDLTPDPPKSGIGIASGISGAFTKRLGNDLMFVASGGADVTLYSEKDFNSYGLSESLEMRRLIPQGYIGIGLVSSQKLDKDDFAPYYLSYGPRISASLQLSPQNHLNLSARHEWWNQKPEGKADSTTINLDGSWTHAWNATFNTTAFAGFDKIKTPSAISSYHIISGGLSIYKELTYGITTTATGTVTKADYNGVNGIAAKKRADNRLVSSLVITKRDYNIFGFAPSLSYTFVDNFSNIDNYDYTSHAVDFRLTKDF